MHRLTPLVMLALAGCAADRSQMNARAASENQTARSNAEHAFFARGYRPLEPPPVMDSLTLQGVNQRCADQTKRAPTDPVDVRLGKSAGTTTFEAACAFASGQKKELAVRLAGATDDTLLTQIPPGSQFAVGPGGKVTRYLVFGQVKEERRGYAEGVSCCCDMPPPPPPDGTFTVVVGPYPATSEELVTYDTVIVTFCDPKAPQ